MMRGTSSKQGNGVGLEAEKPHVSGAYIKTLVKQLTSTQSKDDDELSQNQNLAKTQPVPRQQQHHQQQPQHKKQVRRRLHTSKPYQERLLNMAEARREIVTALKLHRSAMKQASEQQKKQQLQQNSPQTSLERGETMLKPRTSYIDNFSCSSFSCPPPPLQYPYSYPISPAPSFIQENINFPLPNQTLGLNLNLHEFNNFDTAPYFTNNNPSYSAPSNSPSTCAPIHPMMDDKEMAEMRSIGEMHQMEWNDTLNFVTSAWWFKFLKTMEIHPGEEQSCGDDYGCYPFDEVMEFPAWLNVNECCLSDLYSQGCSQDPALPCMDIEEIEGMDVEWLA